MCPQAHDNKYNYSFLVVEKYMSKDKLPKLRTLDLLCKHAERTSISCFVLDEFLLYGTGGAMLQRLSSAELSKGSGLIQLAGDATAPGVWVAA